MSKKIAKIIDELKQFMEEVDFPARTPDEGKIQNFVATKQDQIKMLATKFIQQRIIGASQVSDLRDRVSSKLLEKIEDASPTMLLRILETISNISFNDTGQLTEILSGGGGNKGSPQNIFQVHVGQQQINSDGDGDSNDAPYVSIDYAMKTMKSFAKIHESLTSHIRTVEAEQLPPPEEANSP